ncbi:peptidoglycan-binding protein [Azospirillum sp. RWY-5-1]|uniref:Peptidoglycan-binding protein n=1 Tax=Azospirillum oleiclasticum TaxID=2735135 RepID=A0ABX2TBX2_9PROT|nr:peptidoglycan-binding domain-containing protein [Azospirillum oleiclasticum]NYZ15284.1 peptidoglycan-binding protein [Azospirillum oleiclasticum]NYZ21295.1 peptidoglycan-binding protein [Azospirillum oleiclasticum]
MGVVSGFRRGRLALALLGGLAAAIAAGGAVAQDPSAADIQWAQTVLKEKGFDTGGRANGQMTPGTRQALSAYQRSVGLPATGQLDSATVAKMMGDRKASSTVGNLAAPKPGGSGTREAQRDVTPRAAPTQRIEGAGTDAEVAYNPVVRGPGSPSAASPAPSHGGSRAPSQAEAPAPQAVPRAAVSAADPAGHEVATTAAAKDEATGWRPPKWAAYGVIGVIVATLGYLLAGWWRSGRTAAVPATAPGGAPGGGERGIPSFDGRREPTFGRREELTAGPLPPLTAERRARR